MADPLIRRLATARRHVALDRADEYLAAWHVFRTAVEATGGSAWVFRGTGHQDQFMEFVEWQDPTGNPLDHLEVTDAMAELESFAAAVQTGEWEEAL